jgi:hypothetical protein
MRIEIPDFGKTLGGFPRHSLRFNIRLLFEKLGSRTTDGLAGSLELD